MVIICSGRNVTESALSQSEEIDITNKVELILKEKGVILWWRGKIQENESSTSDAAVPASFWIPAMNPKEDGHSDTPKKVLMLKTAIRYGVISYGEKRCCGKKRGLETTTWIRVTFVREMEECAKSWIGDPFRERFCPFACSRQRFSNLQDEGSNEKSLSPWKSLCYNGDEVLFF